jgi:hypothetical protein
MGARVESRPYSKETVEVGMQDGQRNEMMRAQQQRFDGEDVVMKEVGATAIRQGACPG